MRREKAKEESTTPFIRVQLTSVSRTALGEPLSLFILLSAGQSLRGRRLLNGFDDRLRNVWRGLTNRPRGASLERGVSAEVLPPEHRGLRVSPIFQRSDLVGRGLEMSEEGERVGISPVSEHC